MKQGRLCRCTQGALRARRLLLAGLLTFSCSSSTGGTAAADAGNQLAEPWSDLQRAMEGNPSPITVLDMAIIRQTLTDQEIYYLLALDWNFVIADDVVRDPVIVKLMPVMQRRDPVYRTLSQTDVPSPRLQPLGKSLNELQAELNKLQENLDRATKILNEVRGTGVAATPSGAGGLTRVVMDAWRHPDGTPVGPPDIDYLPADPTGWACSIEFKGGGAVSQSCSAIPHCMISELDFTTGKATCLPGPAEDAGVDADSGSAQDSGQGNSGCKFLRDCALQMSADMYDLSDADYAKCLREYAECLDGIEDCTQMDDRSACLDAQGLCTSAASTGDSSCAMSTEWSMAQDRCPTFKQWGDCRTVCGNERYDCQINCPNDAGGPTDPGGCIRNACLARCDATRGECMDKCNRTYL